MRTTINDFRFIFVGRGAYNVTYESPVTHKAVTKYVTNMALIDDTKNEGFTAKQKDLETLKKLCKS